MEIAAAGVTLAAGHDGSGQIGSLVSPLVLLGLACNCVLPNISGGFPHHYHYLSQFPEYNKSLT